mmetsp:Transcript_49131/g.141240  ORF Transcript_49131/g.141240 Transcript_49131/m.141240 type:complete len:348 (-) Transcript_49131:65-1108(-)
MAAPLRSTSLNRTKVRSYASELTKGDTTNACDHNPSSIANSNAACVAPSASFAQKRCREERLSSPVGRRAAVRAPSTRLKRSQNPAECTLPSASAKQDKKRSSNATDCGKLAAAAKVVTPVLPESKSPANPFKRCEIASVVVSSTLPNGPGNDSMFAYQDPEEGLARSTSPTASSRPMAPGLARKARPPKPNAATALRGRRRGGFCAAGAKAEPTALGIEAPGAVTPPPGGLAPGDENGGLSAALGADGNGGGAETPPTRKSCEACGSAIPPFVELVGAAGCVEADAAPKGSVAGGAVAGADTARKGSVAGGAAAGADAARKGSVAACAIAGADAARKGSVAGGAVD